MARNVRTNQDNTFETIIRSFQPFMNSYGITGDRRVKLQFTAAVGDAQLEAALNNSGGRAERSGNGTVFVRFDDNMTSADAKKIVSLVFGEAMDDVEEDAPVDSNFGELPGERDVDQG